MSDIIPTPQNTFERVRNVIVDQLGVHQAQVSPEVSFVDLGADSLDAVELFMALEEEFLLEIDEREAEAATTVGNVVALVDRLRDVPDEQTPSFEGLGETGQVRL